MFNKDLLQKPVVVDSVQPKFVRELGNEIAMATHGKFFLFPFILSPPAIVLTISSFHPGNTISVNRITKDKFALINILYC